jgi:hypothetical protein
MIWLKALLSDAVGIADDARVGAFLLVLTYCGATVASVVMSPTHEFHAQEFGIGAGALAAGIGALFGLRKDN